MLTLRKPSFHTAIPSTHPNSSCFGRQPVSMVRRGAACVELAVLLPLLIFLFVIAVDFGRVFYFSQTVAQCARNGAEYESDPVAASESPYKNYEEAAKASAPAFMRDQMKVTKTTNTDSSGSHVRVNVSFPFSTVTNYPGIPNTMNISHAVGMRYLSKNP